jgi:hypothetical protein
METLTVIFLIFLISCISIIDEDNAKDKITREMKQ